MEIIWKGWIIVETKKDRYFYQLNIKRLSYCIIECCTSNLDNPMFYLSYYHKWYGLGDKKNIVVFGNTSFKKNTNFIYSPKQNFALSKLFYKKQSNLLYFYTKS